MMQAFLYLSTLSHISIFLLYFACALKTGFVMSYYVPYDQHKFLANFHNMKMFVKIAAFLQNQFINQKTEL